jgi:hypothetical protein
MKTPKVILKLTLNNKINKTTTCGISACGKSRNSKTLEKKSSHKKRQEMAGKYFILFLVLLVSESFAQQNVSTSRIIDHSNIFNRSIVWLTIASETELYNVICAPAFCRFSETSGKKYNIIYDSERYNSVDTLILNRIKTSIYNNMNGLKKFGNISPTVEYFQWAEYLERIEQYDKGPVFVFKDKQLTHIWLDLN